MFSDISKFLREWKPIHLCWWFEKHGWPVPPYFVGTSPAIEQTHFNIGDDDNTDPDACTFDGEDTDRADQVKSSNFMVRLQAAETNGAAINNANWQLYVHTSNDSSAA
ncbi:hypothetical protein AMJ85_11590, partial [candidate division BRC1 bacterium SM23_51]